MTKKFGYARVSTEDQNLERQLDALKKYGTDEILEEKMTGTAKSRPVLDNLRSSIRKGDTIVIESLSRLGRSTKNLLELIEEFQDKGVKLVSLKENIDISTPTGKLLLTVLSAISQFERDIIVQRTKEGLSSARARGRKGGRPKVNAKKLETALKMYDSKQHSIAEITATTGIKKSTLYNAIQKAKNKLD